MSRGYFGAFRVVTVGELCFVPLPVGATMSEGEIRVEYGYVPPWRPGDFPKLYVEGVLFRIPPENVTAITRADGGQIWPPAEL